jgi:hypothetical protein
MPNPIPLFLPTFNVKTLSIVIYPRVCHSDENRITKLEQTLAKLVVTAVGLMSFTLVLHWRMVEMC